MRLTDRQRAVIYNLGALISYVSLAMLLLDALHSATHHDPVTLTRFGFAISWVIGAVLMAPYMWNRIWLRVSSLVQILVLSAVSFLYIEAGFQ